MIVGILLVLTLATAELGLAMGHNMSLVVATREGARVAAQYGPGTDLPGGPASVDPLIIAAVERALKSSGAAVDMSRIDEIHIYESDSTGAEGLKNVWRPGAGPVVNGQRLDFYEASAAWPAASRSVNPPDSVGVSITYRYKMITPLSALTGLFGTRQITMSQSSVMAVEP